MGVLLVHILSVPFSLGFGSAKQTAPPFWIYPDAAFNFKPLLDCWKPWTEDDQAGEGAVLDLLERHPSRVMEPESARLFVVPVMPYINAAVDECNGLTAERRIHQAVSALRRSHWLARNGGRDHMVITHTFRPTHMRPFKALLENATIAWFEHPLAKKRGPSAVYRMAWWRCTVTMPYLANPRCADLRSAEPQIRREPGTGFFQGTLEVAKQLRGQFYHLMGEPWARIHHVDRNLTRRKDGIGNPLDPAVSAFTKIGTARGMLRAEFCLAPKGDTPSSGRFFSAIACGCIPVVISDLLPGHLPFSRFVDYQSFAVFIDEFGFLDWPKEYLTKALQSSQPKADRLRAAMQRAMPDLLHFSPGSRVGTNLLLQWQNDCEPSETPPVKPQKLVPPPGSLLQMHSNGLVCGGGSEAEACRMRRAAKLKSGQIQV